MFLLDPFPNRTLSMTESCTDLRRVKENVGYLYISILEYLDNIFGQTMKGSGERGRAFEEKGDNDIGAT